MRSVTASDFEYHNEPKKTADVHLGAGSTPSATSAASTREGYLYLSDRKIDMIISGGVNIYPAEIESVLVNIRRSRRRGVRRSQRGVRRGSEGGRQLRAGYAPGTP